MELPHQKPAVSGWQLYDYADAYNTGKAAADGTVAVELPTIPDGQLWVVDRLLLQTTSSNIVTCRLYDDNGRAAISLIDGARIPSAPSFASGDNASPYRLHGGKTLTAYFTAANNGDLCTIRAWWTVLQRITGLS